MNLKFQPTKKIKLPDGSTACIWEGKLHNTDGPALVYENGKKEYYIHGIKYTEKQWKEHCKQREGLPWFKSSSGKTSGARV
jgi:hypothetical protein